MRYVTFSLPGDPTERFGAVANDRVIDVTEAVKDTWPGPAPDSLLALIQAGPDAWQRMASMLQPRLDAGECRQPPPAGHSMARADSASAQEHLLPGSELPEPREGSRTGPRTRAQDPRSAGLLHQDADDRHRTLR